MTPSDGEWEQLPARKSYVPPRIIFSELYSKGVGKDPALHGTPEYHSPLSSESTS